MPAHLARRQRELRRRLVRLHVSALLVTNPRDIHYLSGFRGEDSWLLVPSRRPRIFLLTDFRFQEEIQAHYPYLPARIRHGPIEQALAQLVRRLRLRRLGLQRNHLTLAQHQRLAKALSRRRLQPIDDGLLEQRSVKDALELKAIRRAIAIQEEAFRQLLKHIRPGVREYELAAHLEYILRQLGADGPGFPTIIAADANAAFCHAVPGPRKLRPGSLLLIDWGARFDGYCSDMTRVLFLGKVAPRLRDIYRIVLEAQAAGIAAIRPGANVQDVDKAVRSVIKKAGYGQYFGHGTGHGIGLDIHELPALSSKATGQLKPGQIVTVEPGIYLPGLGGVRIEDDVLVTPTGARLLTHLPKDLDSAII